jgi:hypothetical protein
LSFRVLDIDVSPKATLHVHTLYLLKLTRTCGTQSQGVAGMDYQTGSHTFTVLIVMFSLLIGFRMLVTRAYIIQYLRGIVTYHIFFLSFIYSLEAMYAAPYLNHDNYDVYDFYGRILPCLGNQTDIQRVRCQGSESTSADRKGEENLLYGLPWLTTAISITMGPFRFPWTRG